MIIITEHIGKKKGRYSTNIDLRFNDTQIKDQLEKTTSDLKERVKELNCLYAVSDVVKESNISIKEAAERIIRIIPGGWQYPEITCVKIHLNDEEYVSDNYSGTTWKLESELTVHGEGVGLLEVCYLIERPEEDDGPFLLEERKLLDAIAVILEKFIEEMQNENDLRVKREKTDEPQWQSIIDLLIKTDPKTLFRLTRKMMYYLSRQHGVSFDFLMNKLCPVDMKPDEAEWCGINMPNPRNSSDILQRVQKDVFEEAQNRLDPAEISDLLHLWLRQDKARPLLLASENRGISLVEITDELNRFRDRPDAELVLSPEDDISIRTSLISRFFTDRLEYINIAKEFMQAKDFATLLHTVVGPAKGVGKLGGKASGILLAEKIIQKEMDNDPKFDNIKFPKSWYVTSDTMLDFIHYNDLDEVTHIKYMEPADIRQEQPFLEQVFKNGAFSAEIVNGLRNVLMEIGERPIIARSSSLLEDSFGAAFSGKYKSLFLANKGTLEERLSSLMDAIAEIYASNFGPDAIEYRRERGLLDFGEEMGVIIQEVVGDRVGPYYLPAYAGVAFSNNEFRWSSRIRRDDGIIRIVAGLGTRAVDRIGNDYPVLVSPKRPEIRVNTQVDEIIKYSQRYIDVINLENGIPETIEIRTLLADFGDEYPNLKNIVSLYRDGTLLRPLGLILDPGDTEMVITFSGLMERSDFISKMERILSLLKKTIGTPVDVEFASDGESLFILQCRPQSQSVAMERVRIPENIPDRRKIFSAERYVTNGHIKNIEYIVYVDPEAYEGLQTREEMINVARVVSDLNTTLPRRKFILMGPGRWGSRGDIKLGVPVKYRDINNTSLLIEIARKKGGYIPEVSFGTHFFQDLVEANIHYLPLYPDDEGNILNQRLLDTAPNLLSKMCSQHENMANVVRLIGIENISRGGHMTVMMDGEANEAVGFFSPPDHWVWRLEKVKEIARSLDSDLYGVVALYVIGSTREATAGPGSDIDLLVHFRGNDEQKEDLLVWFDEWSIKLDRENKDRTGHETEGILDVHIITDRDIETRNSWASHIGSLYGAAQKIPLGQNRSNNRDQLPR